MSGLGTGRRGGGGDGLVSRMFREHRAGVVGAGILVAVALVALVAPLLISPDALDVTRVTAAPWQSPSGE
ncbi:MAG TPA: hypothetical protein VF821_31745, partial [Lentzea sp.]